MSKFCQSCGMPMKKDLGKGGTNRDGSKSDEYCSLCFQQGEFLQADITAADMQAFCMDKITEQGMPRFIAWLLTRNIPGLARWKQ